jgi:hypothetical protein
MALIMMLVCFLVHLFSVLATVYVLLNGRMTVNVERSCVMACEIYEIQVEGIVLAQLSSGLSQ